MKTLKEGELGLTTDQRKLYIGTSAGNEEIAKVRYVDERISELLPILYRLNNLSWVDIARISKAGEAPNYWSVGDEKDITLTTGEVLTLQIYGFGHDDLAGGGKAGITFGLKHLMQTHGV